MFALELMPLFYIKAHTSTSSLPLEAMLWHQAVSQLHSNSCIRKLEAERTSVVTDILSLRCLCWNTNVGSFIGKGKGKDSKCCFWSGMSYVRDQGLPTLLVHSGAPQVIPRSTNLLFSVTVRLYFIAEHNSATEKPVTPDVPKFRVSFVFQSKTLNQHPK